MKGCELIFYTPENQYPGMPHGEMCGDIMPFYWEGRYILFFLYKYCIYAVETEDFVRYGKCRLVLQNGSPEEQDWHAATGSVFHHAGLFYFYYTGFCEGNRGVEGKYEQAILRAVSRDLIHWKKDGDYFFAPDVRHYGGEHWRDPQVFWNQELSRFCMLVTATEKEGARLRNGCTAVYTSEDMREWGHYQTIYAPRTYPTHECQDAFQMGGRWYLIFSDYARQWETRYRYAERFDGPWEMPEQDDMFDGREFYAAKTVTDGKRRYLVGWLSIRKDCRNTEKFVWGGNACVHELVQREDGSLGVRLVEAVRASFSAPLPMAVQGVQGSWARIDGMAEDREPEGRLAATGSLRLAGMANDGFGWAMLGMLKEVCFFEATLRWNPGTRAVGLMLHADGEALESWCQLRLELTRGRLAMDSHTRINGDQGYEDCRPIRFREGEAKIQLVVSGTIMQAYVDDVALTTRCYGVEPGKLGVFVEYGAVQCTDMCLMEQA